MLARTYRCLAERGKQPLMTLMLATVIAMSNVGVEPVQAAQNLSPIGQDFTVTPSDLKYILKQIKIAEAHVMAPNLDPVADPDNCQALVGPGPNQIPSPLISYGLRTVNGACNNLQPTQEKYGASDQVFPRLTTPVFRPAEDITASLPVGPPGPTSYAQTSGSVVDSQPRMISNLIVDQTSSNPAAVFVAEHPARTQGAEGVLACSAHPELSPPACVPPNETLFIENVTTDVGLSPPFNSLFTIFGQFFDHGLDKITNGGNGQVFVPLKDDDPLVAGPDHIFGNGDDLDPSLRFMVLTRGTVVDGPGPDGVLGTPDDTHHEALNTDTPFVDQSQTYTSHSSHQVFTREYKLVEVEPGVFKPFVTGKFLSTADGGIATWAMVKEQARLKLGLQLVDADVDNIPMIAADQYGNFIPGPARGMPQYVTSGGTGLLEGDPAANGGLGVPAPADVVRIDTAFLNDIAHNAAPTCSIGSPGCPATGVKAPDANDTAGGSLAPAQAAGEYDDELLNLHYICGDGRCNENIALTAVHEIFHMEHDRLVDVYYNDLGTGVLQQPGNEDLLLDYQTTIATGPNKTFTFEERLFQAARFVTEMQYQHLVFEEFARKVQPAINPFEPFAFNQTDLNSAITAEFAHAVYRFGHSMLHDTIPRINEDGTHNDIPLFDGFLNPAAFTNGFTQTDRQATGSIIMGLSDQAGNEIDEFVADTLRNNLLGLPLDLPSINMARARSEGIPSLNNVRKQIFEATNDGQLAPYSNWIDFEQNIKHSVSLENFIAAYGKHPTIRDSGPDGLMGNDCGTPTATPECADNNTTLAGKRAAAHLIVTGGPSAPADSAAFLFSTGAWANVGGVSQTGLDDVDLWVGGLAELTNLFGGLLGSTFNYVFEKQLTDLQNGDRLYYLARTPGMNLRSQLEGNSFAELVMRNTNPYTHTLKADPFATADCKFELANLAATPQGFIDFGSVVADDPASECDESALLLRMPDGTIKYRATNTVDPPGINGQSVFNGTDFADSFYGGNDNDTFWGGLGDDTINGGGGDDIVLGGDGDDIITDFAGVDILKGGPGNDAIDGGPGDDILMPGIGKDFTNGGANINETFASEGDDFAIAGQGLDAVFGDSGDDWQEGGDQPDLLIGDSSSLFFDDLNKPGHDILIGQGGDDDYDMEGGDDIGVSGPGVEKIAGAAGYDWEIGLGDPQAQVMDLAIPLLGVPLPVNQIRDKFNEVEALSGWKFNDTLMGDSVIPSQVAGGGFIGCDALDADGVGRIAGLELLVTTAMMTVDSAPITAAASTNYCGLEGPVWGEGNILLGGAGNDSLEGRGANDILDGDKYMNVRLSVRNGADDVNGVDTVTDGSGVEIGSTGLMQGVADTGGDFGPGTTGMNLQQAVFARKVNPGNIVAVREILRPAIVPPDCAAPAASRVNCDKALFSGPANEYSFTGRADGSVIVTDNTDPAAVAVPIAPAVPRSPDGIDILWNMEQLVFCTTPGAVKGTCTTRSAPISIIPVASVTGNFGFGSVVVGTTSQRKTVTVRNTGVSGLVVGSVTVTGADAGMFTITEDACTGASLAQNSTCTISMTFSPTSGGDKVASVVVAHNGAGFQTVIAANGTGAVPVASVSPSALDFGNQTVLTSATQVITVANTGVGSLTIGNILLSGSTSFTKLAGGCVAGTNVAAGSSCLISIRFRPAVGGTHTGSLTIVDNSGAVTGSEQTVSLTGNGTVTAVDDTFSATANTNTAPQAISFNVRTNDLPNVAASTVSIVPGSIVVSNGGASASVSVIGATLNTIRWVLTPAGADANARAASKRGTYTVTYMLTNGTATATATYTLTVI